LNLFFVKRRKVGLFWRFFSLFSGGRGGLKGWLHLFFVSLDVGWCVYTSVARERRDLGFFNHSKHLSMQQAKKEETQKN